MENKHKILYVEDEPNLGRIVKDSLEFKGFDVRMVEDGSNVLREYRSFNPDIIVLDVMLPHKSGFEIAEELRSLQSRTPILFLSAKTRTEDVLEGFSTGGNDYMKKPFSLEELIARINNLIQIAGYKESTLNIDGIPLGKYTYFPDKYELVHPDKSKTTLSLRENELMSMLCSQNDATVERKTILLKIWGDDSYYNSRTLDVYIRKLREYLKEDENVKILTIKGLGYRVIIES